MSDLPALGPRWRLPAELEGWVIVKAQEESGQAYGRHGYVVWLERVMPDGTTLRFEALIHDPERELPMLVPVIVAVTSLSQPDVRLRVVRNKTTSQERLRGQYRRRLTG